MRPVDAVVGALGNSKWLPMNYVMNCFQIGMAVYVYGGLTCKVQHTMDDPGPDGRRVVSIARTTTVATVTDKGKSGLGHGLAVGDGLVIESGSPTFATETADVASVIDLNTYTYTVPNSGATADPSARLSSFRVFDHPLLTGLTARLDGNYAFNIQAIRLKVTAYTSGFAELIALSGMGR